MNPRGISIGLASCILPVGGVLCWNIGFAPRHAPLSIGDAIEMSGKLAAVKALDLDALQQSLPVRLRRDRRVLLIVDTCTCKWCATFPSRSNETDVDGLLVTEAATPIDRLDARVTILAPGTLHGLPTEVYMAQPIGLLVDFRDRSVVPAAGPFLSWSECLDRISLNETKFKEKI